MSGIAGIVNLDGAPVAPRAIEAMLATMDHRGPDRRTGWRRDNSALGQVLLITTLEAAAEVQPWMHPGSRCVVVSDSRLDNRHDSLRTLGLTHAPADEIGDGELLHAAWQKWGEECADHLRGDFAFAIWDPARQHLFAARDVMGVRPFYYHLEPGRLFVFASQTSAILSNPEIPIDVDEGRIADAMVGDLEGINNTCTFYRQIVRLPPAHTLLLSNGQLRLRRYWNVVRDEPRGLPRSDAEWIEALHSQLVQSVQRRLRSSQRVGSMLSGGVDSSAVVALASGLLRSEQRGPLPTFSAINSAGECLETEMAISMVRFSGADATTIDVSTQRDAVELLGERYRQCEEPFDGIMPLIQVMYAAAAGAGVRSLMDGMPADNLYTTNQYAQRLARQRRWAAAYAWALDDHRETGTSHARARALRSIAVAWLPLPIRELRKQRSEQRFLDGELIRQSLISKEFAERVRLRDRLSEFHADMERSVEMDESGRALSSMTASYITAAIERYGRMAARCGVEPRHPFLDRELIEFHAWVPFELRRRNGWHKWILRQAMRNEMPQDVLSRRRTGHLGSTLAMRANGRLLSDETTLGSIFDTLGARVDRQKAGVAVRLWRSNGDESAFRMVHNAVLVGRWLENAGKTLKNGAASDRLFS